MRKKPRLPRGFWPRHPATRVVEDKRKALSKNWCRGKGRLAGRALPGFPRRAGVRGGCGLCPGLRDRLRGGGLMYFVSGVRSSTGEAFCFGYFVDFGDVEAAVVNNCTDLTDGGLFDHVVIEEIPPGLYRFAARKWWYRYDPAAGRFVPCAAPAGFGSHLSVAMGQDFQLPKLAG